MSLEEQKKLVIPFLQRAQEIQTVEPRVAYYCRCYALQEILNLGSGAAEEIKGIMKALFMQLEKDRPSLLPLNPEADLQHCINFALRIFRNADKADCAGKADLNTSKAYYAASIFLQITAQFNDKDPETGEQELDSDLAQKARYAVWRAAEIRKALKEGRAPVPPNSNLLVPTGGAMQGLAAGGGDPNDPFTGPAYEPGADDMVDPGPNVSGVNPMPDLPFAPPPLPMGAGLDSIGSAVDDFLNLPPPPQSQLPPAALVHAVAAAAGPRYSAGSKVLAVLPDGGLEPATVGMVVAPGPNTMYKVAFRDRLADVVDSCLAPVVPEGAKARWVRDTGAVAITVTVLASNMDRWPCTYLIQTQSGATLDTDCYHMMPVLEQMAAPPPPAAAASGFLAGAPLPAAPPLTDQDKPVSSPYPHISSGLPTIPAGPTPAAPPAAAAGPQYPAPSSPRPTGAAAAGAGARSPRAGGPGGPRGVVGGVPAGGSGGMLPLVVGGVLGPSLLGLPVRAIPQPLPLTTMHHRHQQQRRQQLQQDQQEGYIRLHRLLPSLRPSLGTSLRCRRFRRPTKQPDMRFPRSRLMMWQGV